MNLKNEVAIITGSTQGIGKSLAFALAKEGTAVVINSRNKQDVDDVVAEINTLGGKAIGVVGPIEVMETGQRLLNAALESFGKLTILINNAGIVKDRISYRMTEEEWDSVLSVHVKGAFSATTPVVQYMVGQKVKGVIITMTSLAGLEGTVGQLNYSTAKAGLLGLTWSLAKEMKPKEVRVYGIAPAAVTNMTRPHIEKAQQLALKRGEDMPDYWKIGTPADVSRFVIQLLQKREKYETGQIFQVNGEKIGRWLPPVYESLSSDGYLE